MSDEIKNIPPKLFWSSLSLSASSYSLRCDAKFANDSVQTILKKIRSSGCFEIGDFLPNTFVKGIQHEYLDVITDDSVPVVNTLSIQNMKINMEDCRYIQSDDFENLSDERKIKINDVLLTVDGGTSIGKAVLFEETISSTVDSHVCILRPQGIKPLTLVYLLTSKVGQMQFKIYESGASGQTTVTEEDIRRFIFPSAALESIDEVVRDIEAKRAGISKEIEQLKRKENSLWISLDNLLSAS
ncbi:hypothetical protein HMPREF0326_01800 [Desulfovibrio sp. 3_1_syn3]|uniref:restriction endonuclease subunit S n=1 Tax=Desulfovibrio sp. 3_1_syn3 TaxID=457398 RepID=UPI0001E12759|nr:restriction endonuclease subunit S [Desulfovibrio sp. 3_1_syn3]EFL86097.1 hypothetical protein HMPREF0326_01800 [Desulfovibrio sp. 3_1_syn3]